MALQICERCDAAFQHDKVGRPPRYCPECRPLPKERITRTPKPVQIDTDAIREIVQRQVIELLNDDKMEATVSKVVRELGIQRVELVTDGVKVTLPDYHHKLLPTLIQVVQAGSHVFMVGPAGSGKSTLAQQVAESMKLRFGALSLGPTTPTSKLFGYMSATGEYISTPFRDCYKNGGIMLLDELDNGHPGLVAEINQALANGYCAFADNMVQKHNEFRMLATGNTFGRGPDRQFVGRNILDAATLDRFATVEVGYDEMLEYKLAAVYANETNHVQRWIDYVVQVRRNVEQAKLPVIVSPRTTIEGSKLLAVGVGWREVADMRLWAGVADDVRRRVDVVMG